MTSPINSKENSAHSMAATSSSSSSSSAAASSSSSSATSTSGSSIKKKRKATVLNTNEPDEKKDTNKRIKVDALFEKAIAKAKEAWHKDNNAKTMGAYANLTHLIRSPLDPAQKKLVLELLNQKPSDQDILKLTDEALVKLNNNLYSLLSEIKAKAEYNEAGLKLLKAAIEEHQIPLIEKIIKNLDLSQDNESTHECLCSAATSNTQIAQLILEKKPCLTFSQHGDIFPNFLRLSIDHNDTHFFAYLLSVKFEMYFFIQTIAGNPKLIEFLKLVVIDKEASQLILHRLLHFACIDDALPNAELICRYLNDNTIEASFLKTYEHIFLRSFMRHIICKTAGFIKLFWATPSLCQNPNVLLAAVHSGDMVLARKLIVERNASPQNALWTFFDENSIHPYLRNDPIRKDPISLNPLNSNYQKIIEGLISLGADINALNSEGITVLSKLLQLITPRKHKNTSKRRKEGGILAWRKNLQTSIDWFLKNGAHLSTKGASGISAFANIVKLNDEKLIFQFIPGLRKLPASDFTRLFNEAFGLALEHCSQEVCSFLANQGQLQSKCIINFQEHLTHLIVHSSLGSENSEEIDTDQLSLQKIKFDFLIKQGANPFFKKDDATLHPLLECCLNRHYENIGILSKIEGFKNHLQVNKDGFGLFTYLALAITIEPECGEYLAHAINLIEDLAALYFSNVSTKQSNIKDIFCAHSLINLIDSTILTPNLDKIHPLAYNQVKYLEIESYKLDLLKLTKNFCIHTRQDVKGFLSILETGFDRIYKKIENLLLKSTSNYKRGLKIKALSEGHKKEISSIDCHKLLQQMLSTTTISKNLDHFKTKLSTFFEIIQKRLHVMGVPNVIPNELNDKKAETEAFFLFEKETRRIVPNDNYKVILEGFLKNVTSNFQGNSKDQEYFSNLKNAIEHISKHSNIHILQHPLRDKFFSKLIAKELFFEGLEDRLRVIIYSYLIEKKAVSPRAASASSSSDAALSKDLPYDPAAALTLLSILFEASSLCASQWIASLIILEDHAIPTIQRYSNDNSVDISELIPLENEIQSVLATQRKQNVRRWAQLKTEADKAAIAAKSSHSYLTQEQQKRLSEDDKNKIVANAKQLDLSQVLGNEAHYFNAAMQYSGGILGIPGSSNISENASYWNQQLSESLHHFIFNDTNNTPTLVIDFIEDGINKHKSIKHATVIDWMQENLIDNWQKVLFISQQNLILSALGTKLASLKALYEGILKTHSTNTPEQEKELAEKIFKPIWTLLTKEQPAFKITDDPTLSESEKIRAPIVFTHFENSIQNAILKGKLFEMPVSPIVKIIESACTLSRKAAFTAELHDEKALNSDNPRFIIKRHWIVAMLLKLNIIQQLPALQHVPPPLVQGQLPLPPLLPMPQPLAPIPLVQQQRFLQLAVQFQPQPFALPPLPPFPLAQPNPPPQDPLGILRLQPPLPAAAAPGQARPLVDNFDFLRHDRDHKDDN